MTLLDVCSYLGLGAVGVVAVNMLIGLLMALRYSPVRLWPHRRVNLFAMHQWTAYLAVALTVSHPAVLLLLRVHRFRLLDVLWPVHSYLQPKMNVVGALALYLVVVVVVSSVLRTRLGRPLWRRLHYFVFPAAVLLFTHSIFTDPELRDGKPDLLDGGKLFVYGCCVVVLAVTVLRVRLSVSLRGRGLRGTRSV